ncbi:hypothetical protein HU985_09280 [Photobacterium damselae subsp. damselae]|uniref:hypothetical protein n=1 Tax=Photobacterium damselae TaxID=38293 RepID=UPI001593DB08|nr:hypothetical protein [Photobacterium damselae]NVH51088.1 hypothetical protein [Photobacterium damselae subsp. damselae]NVO81198.1 hypothetical protein [Photobacterium damselae subsp. damselae]
MSKEKKGLIDTVSDFAEASVDLGNDLIEKVSSPASRAGSVVERAGRLLEENVDPEVVALQMTKNSPNKHNYTADGVQVLGQVYQDAKTKVVLTSEQTRGLIKDQREQDSNNGTDPLPN